jgi:hypothetical protein
MEKQNKMKENGKTKNLIVLLFFFLFNINDKQQFNLLNIMQYHFWLLIGRFLSQSLVLMEVGKIF